MKHQVLIPFILVVGVIVVHWMILASAILNNYKLNYKALIPNQIVYLIIVIALVIFTLTSASA